MEEDKNLSDLQDKSAENIAQKVSPLQAENYPQAQEDTQQISYSSKRTPKLALISLVILILIFFSSILILNFLVKKTKKDKEVIPTPSEKLMPEATNLPSQSITPSQKVTPNPAGEIEKNAGPFTIRVLGIGFNPKEDGKNFAETFFKGSLGDKSPEEIEDLVFENTKKTFKNLSGNLINFEIIRKIHIEESPLYPDGFRYTLETYKKCVGGNPEYEPGFCENKKWQFNSQVVNWIRNNKICEIAKEINADEIWMLSIPYIGIPWENFMIGPSPGFNVNGEYYIVPECSKHYIGINANYSRSTNFLHNYAHRIESTMSYLMSGFKKEDRQKFWLDFVVPNTSKSFCGNAHVPSNTIEEYDYTNKNFAQSSCVDWLNFPNFTGKTENISCDTWGCTDYGWQAYWFSNLPKSPGWVELQSFSGKSFKFSKNWWYYILFPHNTIELRNSLL